MISPTGSTGRQAGEGILEDDLHLRAQWPAFPCRTEVIDLPAVEQHLAAGLFAAQAQDGAAGGGLAAAGLAHQTHGGAALQIEGDAVHGLDLAHHVWETMPPLMGKYFFRWLTIRIYWGSYSTGVK